MSVWNRLKILVEMIKFLRALTLWRVATQLDKCAPFIGCVPKHNINASCEINEMETSPNVVCWGRLLHLRYIKYLITQYRIFINLLWYTRFWGLCVQCYSKVCTFLCRAVGPQPGWTLSVSFLHGAGMYWSCNIKLNLINIKKNICSSLPGCVIVGGLDNKEKWKLTMCYWEM